MQTYIESIEPSSGRVVAPRTWVDPTRTTRRTITLNGTWDFRLHPTTRIETDRVWETIELPNHWVFTGTQRENGRRLWDRGTPIYTNVNFPFPHNPPHVPDANPTAEHVKQFTLSPSDWEVLRAGGRAVLRLAGVESIAQITLNDSPIGIARGSRLQNDFDVTETLVEGKNTLSLLVSQWSAMSYVEDQDQWWLPGVFRDVELLIEPREGISDLRIITDYDADTHSGSLRLWIESVAGTADVSVADTTTTVPTGQWETIEFSRIEPWSAESPTLYELTVTTPAETRTERIGFRRIEIREIDGEPRILANGYPVVFRGVNKHETHPDQGRVFDEEQVRDDLALMKRHHINAIRTAHYPHHPKTLDLFDEMGFWVIDEVDLETHAFEYVGWRGNPTDDPQWREVCVDRARRSVIRDYNHPSVIMWSLGNESGTGANLAHMATTVRDLDLSRIIHYESDHDGAYSDVYSRMYTPFEEVAAICTDTGTIHRGSISGQAHVRKKPFVLCEYAHAMGNGPGALKGYDDLIEKYPRFHGGFVWEWRDHGLRTWDDEGTEYFGYGGDFGEVIHDGNFVMDGLIRSDGTPMPALAELAAVNTPLKSVVSGDRVRITNRFHTLRSRVAETHVVVDGQARGVLEHDLAPGESAEFDLSSYTHRDSQIDIIHQWADDRGWAPAGCEISRVQLVPHDSPAVRTPVVITESETAHKLSLPFSGARISTWRAPTDNDRLRTFGSYTLGAPDQTAGIGVRGPSSEEMWRETGLDRIRCHHRETKSVRINARPAMHIVEKWAPDASDRFIDTSWLWDGEELVVHIVPSAGWEGTWPRTGIHFDIERPDRVSWRGLGPDEAYSDSLSAPYLGDFEMSPYELGFMYARPQENGTRVGVRHLELSYADRIVTIECQPDMSLPAYAHHYPSFSLSPWDEHELTVAEHPHELAQPTARWHLFIDAGQHGLGSRSCGPDVRPEFAWTARAVTLRLTIRSTAR
ncbi:MAG: glycoside hydrolase family 2 TIM barrel-domain containing protein [Actinomycetaceae bacterium]|nr:glycoside hydrolase family 2 TIM barrel-domain containing protein [Actinomycetaceae bacterium]